MAEKSGADAPDLKTKMVYGLGSVAFGAKDAGFNTFLLIFYNQVLGVPATLVSFAIFVALLWDAVFDPVIGTASDNLRSRFGRRHPFMYASALPIALGYFFLWHPPQWQPQQLFFYVLAMAILVRTAIACYEIPSAAMAPELSPNYDERTSILAWRWLFGALGAFVTIGVAFLFFMVKTKTQPVGILNHDAYFSYGLMAACVMFASILISAAGTHSRIKTFRQVPPTRSPTLAQIAREVLQSISNRSFLMVTLSGLFGGIAAGLSNSLNTYLGTYFWKFTPQQLSTLGVAILLATVIAFAIAGPITRRFDKRNGFIVAAFGSLFVNNITMALKLLGWMPPDGSVALLGIWFVTVTIGGALAICAGIIVSSMITDIVEDSEVQTGRRSEGLFSSSITFVQKATSGFGVLFAGVMIDLVHFPVHASPATIDPLVVRHLVILYMPTQLLLWAVAIALVGTYRIDRATHQRNLDRLAEMTALAEAPTAGVIVAGADDSQKAAPPLHGRAANPLPAPGE